MLVRGIGTASMTPASSSRQLPVTQHTGKYWLNSKIAISGKGVRCRPARCSTDVCQRGTVSPHPQGAQLSLRLVSQCNIIHYTVGQLLLGDSLPFLLTSVANKELLRASEAPGAVHTSNQIKSQIKSLLLSHHHSTSALVSEILMSVLQTVKKKKKNNNNNLHMESTYLQTVQKTMCKIHIHILSTHSVL